MAVLSSFSTVIYNHLQIRRELEQADLLQSPWRGHSDTETLLAIEAWGLESALHRCVGMFALALWDRKDRLLNLARIFRRNLFIALFNMQVVCLSVPISLPRSLPDLKEPRSVLTLFLPFSVRSIPAPFCIYKGLQQLPPGSLVCIPDLSDSSSSFHLPKPYSWWSPAAFAPQLPQTCSLEDLQSALEQSVVDYSTADVPLGSFLSGGIDSSLITALLRS